MSESKPIGFVQVRQEEYDGVPQIIGPYDLVLTVASWETRSTATADILAKIGGNVHVVNFAPATASVSEKKKSVLASMRSSIGDLLVVCEMGPSLEFEANIKILQKLIGDALAKKGLALRVLLDMTCMPKRYLLFLLGLGFRGGQFSQFDLLYAEGKYEVHDDPAAGKTTRRGLVSEGEWSSVQVPYLEAKEYAPSKRDLCVSVGAEITVALPLIERVDPDRIRLVRIAESEKRVPKAVLGKETKSIESLLAYRGSSQIEYVASDVMGVAQDILAYANNITTCLAIGSKPHAIAFGLAALADDRIEVVCRAPRAYSFGDVLPTGKFYWYSIQDRFDPIAYLNVSGQSVPGLQSPAKSKTLTSKKNTKRRARKGG